MSGMFYAMMAEQLNQALPTNFIAAGSNNIAQGSWEQTPEVEAAATPKPEGFNM